MSFFPRDPEIVEPEEPESAQPQWWAPPEDELPVLFPVSEILAATDHVAIALLGVRVHRDGMEFAVERKLRRQELPMTDWGELCAQFMEHWPTGGATAPADRLRFGLVLGDGEKVLADQSLFAGGVDPTIAPTGHTLTRRGGGGGGGGRSYSASDALWLWPAPPAGPIELVMQWPALGIGERHLVLDGTEMLAHIPQVQPLWP